IDRQRLRESLHGEGLGEAGNAFDEDVATGQQSDQQPVEQVVLPDDHLAKLGLDPLEGQRLALDITVESSDIQFHSAISTCCKRGATGFVTRLSSTDARPA